MRDHRIDQIGRQLDVFDVVRLRNRPENLLLAEQLLLPEDRKNALSCLSLALDQFLEDRRIDDVFTGQSRYYRVVRLHPVDFQTDTFTTVYRLIRRPTLASDRSSSRMAWADRPKGPPRPHRPKITLAMASQMVYKAALPCPAA